MKKTGVLLANLGSPDAPTPEALRRYLAQFLSDRRVVDLPRWLWWPILHGIILRNRPRRSAEKYRGVWTSEGAPLLVISRRQEAKLRELFGGHLAVALGMRYGNPSINEALLALKAQGVERIVVLPLYPQNSCSTTASTFDAVAEELKQWRAVPELLFISDYHDNPSYLNALAASVRTARAEHGPVEKLLFSFHGTPLRYRDEGDPYYDQCLATAAGVATRLGLAEGEWEVVFQSRFGREEWLRPYADERLQQLAREGVGSVAVICPGFSADCLETLEEMGEENRESFLRAGGGTYHYIPALNDRDDHMAALAEVALSVL